MVEKDNRQVNKLHKRKRLIEGLLWIVIFIGLAIIVLQAAGLISWFVLKEELLVFSLIILAFALAIFTLNQYFINSRLRNSLKKMIEHQKNNNITLQAEHEQQDEDENSEWKEQVRFNAVIEERQRLARELHDAVSQQLFAISMTATAVSRTMEKDWERAKHQVQLIEEMASVAQSEMRALLLHLRPVHLDGRSLGLAIQKLVEELHQKVHMDIELHLDTSLLMKQEIEDHLFRITQEALSNTLRHAKATQLSITLFKLEQDVHLYIEDNGIGFDNQNRKQGSYGLLTMEERVRELDGKFSLCSEFGKGTRIEIIIPYIEDDTVIS